MDKSNKTDLKVPLLQPETVVALNKLHPAEREKVLDVASKILARHLKSRSTEIRYLPSVEKITTTVHPVNQGTLTPPPFYTIGIEPKFDQQESNH